MATTKGRVVVDVDAVDIRGKPITVKGVVGEQDLKTGVVYLDPGEVARREIEQLGEALGLTPRSIPILLLLRAQAGVQQAGGLFEKYRWNKALFYLWKKLEEIGLGEAMPHDEFEKLERGPVPANLDADLMALEAAGLVEVEWIQKHRGPVTHDVQLTKVGMEVASKLWGLLAPDYLETATWVKSHIVPKGIESIKKEVHRDYPEWAYTQVDDEGAASSN
jgi:hypothetical protein